MPSPRTPTRPPPSPGASPAAHSPVGMLRRLPPAPPGRAIGIPQNGHASTSRASPGDLAPTHLAPTQLHEKDYYWIPHPANVFAMVMVKRIDKEKCLVTTVDDNKDLELDVHYPFFPVNPATVADMATLPHIHEAGVLSNLKERAKVQHQSPYTYIAHVLVAVNPLRDIAEPRVEDYRDQPITANEPHPFGVAELAYSQMTLPKIDDRNQYIVITGESGAGKSETSKIVTRYFGERCATAGNPSARTTPPTPARAVPPTPTRGPAALQRNLSYSAGAKAATMAKVMEEAGVVLEAFGNAKTARNNNSSRFGRVTKLYFDEQSQYGLSSAAIETYLLEKSRVVSLAEGERNYHVFYQLLAAGDKKKWRLKGFDKYNYVTQSSEVEIENVDDKENFGALCSAFASLGIAQVEQDLVFRVLSTVLALGNIEFRGDDSSEEDITVVEESYTVTIAAELLGVSREALEQVLLNKTAAEEENSTTSVMRTPIQAAATRDSIAKSLYSSLFSWVVTRLNVALSFEKKSEESPFIGIIDIFGFEKAELNRLEQLLINYADEALQMSFEKSVILGEHAIFREEGFSSGDFSAATNAASLDLISRGQKSILNLLNRVCWEPHPLDDKFISAMCSEHKKNPLFSRPTARDSRHCFVVRHYADSVQYTEGNFVNGNMDSDVPELRGLLSTSSFSGPENLISYLSEALSDTAALPGAHTKGPGGATLLRSMGLIKTKLVARRRSAASDNSDRGSGDPVAAPAQPANDAPLRMTPTVFSTFHGNLSRLCNSVESTSNVFIRCVKPSLTMNTGVFDQRYIVAQLRSMGIVQTCDVFREGLPTHLSFDLIEGMYRPHLKPEAQKKMGCLSSREFVKAVLWSCSPPIPKEVYQLGSTRLFFRTGCLKFLRQVTSMDMTSPARGMLSGRVMKYIVRCRWRRAFFKVRVAMFVVQKYRHAAARNHSAVFLQTRWRYFFISPRYKRKRLNRRRWRIAICRVLFQNKFLRDYELIVESKALRQKNENQANEEIQALQAAEDKRRYAAETAAQKLDRTGSTDSEASVSDEIAKNDIGDAMREQGVAKAKSEMQALRFASNLATVSVCLRRWIKIKLFRCLDKWKDLVKDDCHIADKVPSSGEDGTVSDSSKSPPVVDTRVEEVQEDARVSKIEALKVEIFNSDIPEKSLCSEIVTDAEGNDVVMVDTAAAVQCYECSATTLINWCGACRQIYCSLCSQLVHGSCRLMRSHKPIAVGGKGNSSNMAERAGHIIESIFSKSKKKGGVLTTGDVSSNRWKRAASMALAQARGAKRKEPCSIKSCNKEATRGVSIRFCEQHYEEFRSTTKGSQQPGESEDQKTLQQQIALLKKQLRESGQQPVEFVELSVARERMHAAVQKLMEGDETAEKDVERWDKTIKMNPDYQKEMEEKALKWAEDQRPANEACVKRMRQLIPPDVRSSDKSKMLDEGVPPTIAARIWKTKALWLICMHPDDVKRIHIVDLKTKYNPQGMDIIELRALFQSLPTEFDLDGDGKKAEWRNNIRMKLEELVNKEANKRLMKNEMRNPAYKGHDDVKIYDPGVEIERQQVAKSDPYAAQEKASDIVGTSGVMKALRNKKAEVKPPICEGFVHVETKENRKLFVSLQSTAKDKGRVLFGFENEEDCKQYSAAVHSEVDADLKSAPKPVFEIELLETHGVRPEPQGSKFVLFDLLEGGSEQVLDTFDGERARWLPQLTDAVKFVVEKEKIAKQRRASVSARAPVTEAEAEPVRPPNPMLAAISGRGGGRGGNPMLAAIAGRGRGGASGEGGNPLMAALAGRGRGGAGRGGEGGGNPLMAAIAGRGRGGAGRGDENGGNPLMAAIAGRGRGGGDGGRGGGNPLMAAIAGRGRGGSGRGDGTGGGNPLLAAIAGRGQGGNGRGDGEGGGNPLMAAIAARRAKEDDG